MMSFELLLDPVTDARIRAEWQPLLDAGLPSQARHTGASNAPHLTLLAARAVHADLGPAEAPGAQAALDADATAALEADAGSGPGLEHRPLPLTLQGFAVFGQPPSGLVLARLVVVSPRLLELHAAVHRRARGVVDLSAFSRPDAWLPHVTLASRLTPAQLADALTALAAEGWATHDLMAGTSWPSFAGPLRHWNGDTKRLTLVPPGPPATTSDTDSAIRPR
ncbi:hypothetical protein B7R54_11970 [Subtercola boreus]|uniref:2'-5' RNA ligase n=1 Tax=Subtercola boreus TaxID=120213 RepID=A0A3E0VIR3_9MICO|nr:2'-5' RNA ligase family protein [Subtercola boreus]RFA09842.1 hypothetical protein B7R54_11970 [Subtercola boreus]TQL53037.1 2'-5' RNA ligase superfamily protein [Subtercola boreus]